MLTLQLHIDVQIINFLTTYVYAFTFGTTNLLYALSTISDLHLDIYLSSPC